MTSEWKAKKLRLSINERLVNKNDLSDFDAYTNGWTNKELSIDELYASILKGHAYCAELSGPRKTNNFAASDIVSIDIDHVEDLTAIKQNELVKSSASLIYTTASHEKGKPRFRIVFILERTITDATEMKAIMRALALRFSGDNAATDATRIFYGNENAEGKTAARGLCNKLIDELIKHGSSIGINGSKEYGVSSFGTSRSKLEITPDLLVKTSNLATIAVSEIEVKTSVFCPFHEDKNPSAFITENKNKQKGIHCMTCQTTFWQKDVSRNYDFNAFENALIKVKQHASENIPDIEVSIDGLFDSTFKADTNIEILDQEFVDMPLLVEGANFVKSPKASGKTEYLKSLCVNSPFSILLIGHRRSLIRQMCNRLGLQCYLDEKEDGSQIRGQDFNRFGVCLDSIGKIPHDMKYDCIFIDESEQVLSHLLSSTLDDRRQHVFVKLRHLIASSKHVFALDADLSEISFEFISKWSRTYDNSKKSSIVLNKYVEQKGSLQVYNSRNEMIGDIFGAIRQGLRCYITSNSRKRIDEMTKAIIDKMPEKRVIKITSETVSAQDQFEFLDNPSKEALKYDVILTSPSVGTGVDITFEDKAQEIDCVYGLFEPLVLTHFECDQQIARVRHPKAIKLYIAPRIHDFETDYNVVANDALNLSLMDHLIHGYTKEGEALYNNDDEFLHLASAIIVRQKASKNRLKENYLKYKSQQGWSIENVDPNQDLLQAGKALSSHGRALSEEETKQKLLSAKAVDSEQFSKLQKKKKEGQHLDVDELAIFFRGTIERFYRQSISAELIEYDQSGKTRKAIRSFERVADNYEECSRDKIANADKAQLILNPNGLQPYLIIACMEAGKVFKNGKFNLDVTITTSDLEDFASFVLSEKSKYESIFNKDVARDLKSKPMSTFNQVLGFIGLRMTKVKTTNNAGKKIYHYQLDKARYQKISEIVALRKKVDDYPPH